MSSVTSNHSLAACVKKINIFPFPSQPVFQLCSPSNRLFVMYDWMEMAAVVGGKLVENGQVRILKRKYDGMTPDLDFDVSDFMESDNHKLLHLM